MENRSDISDPAQSQGVDTGVNLRSVHTENLPAIFEQLRISLAVSTYQAGKLILVRRDDQGLNTHFRHFGKPMGIALNGSRLAVGGVNSVWDYRDMPALAERLHPLGRHDACFVPRGLHVTGDIDVHEMAFDSDGELWIVNTRFGCLCTLSPEHSFVPRWRPNFLSALAPEDRCHLNGLAIREGRPRYVTALGESDVAGGWREHRAAGGLLMDVDSGEIVLRGLSMPHSPRWYRNQLWVLESGAGTLAMADPDSGSWRVVAEMPGFTRGLAFYGPLAFVGLSEIRESAIFSGIPLINRVEKRSCGIWVINIETGQTLGFLRFEAGVQEIFAVEVLPETCFPEMLDWNDTRLAQSYVLPDEALSDVRVATAEELRESPAAYFQEGVHFHQQGEFGKAIECFRACVDKDSTYPHARFNLAISLSDDEQFGAAEDHMLQVVKLEPQRAEAFNSLGHVAAQQRRPDEAISRYRRAIELEPEYAVAHFNLGMTLLQIGDFEEGWAEYEWRWKTPAFTPFESPKPRWDGHDLGSGTLLVHTEQGAGDAAQFARYLPMARQRCGKLILVCTESMRTLLSVIDGVDEVHQPGSFSPDAFDAYVPIMSLPALFGTRLSSIPNATPYIEIDRLQAMRGRPRLRSSGAASVDRPKVGIVWGGSPTHSNDHHRSLKLETLAPLLTLSHIDFHGLQADQRRTEISALPPHSSMLDSGSPEGGDFTDLALRLSQLDLLISVDTAAAHIAGAMGLPVWILLPHVPDWRWGLDGNRSPWYPSVRLYRQDAAKAWTGVIQRLVQDLSVQFPG